MFPPQSPQSGVTLLELLISLAIATMLLTALTGMVSQVFEVQADTQVRNKGTGEIRFAMQRMVTAIRESDRLLLPLVDNPATNWRENVREENNPAAAPEGSSTLATAVLALTLGPLLDRDEDGFADADNDNDGMIDEDPGGDLSWDSASGIVDIDDDGDGTVDEEHTQAWQGNMGPANEDDDEDDFANEDNMNGLDDDGDGSVDEDQKKDLTGDALSGIGGFDDDGDGTIDEDDKNDDDEDGAIDEDWIDSRVFYLVNETLLERLPNLNPVDGTDFTEYPIADNVTYFRVERLPLAGRRALLVDITLEVTLPGGEPTSLNTRVRVGGSL